MLSSLSFISVVLCKEKPVVKCLQQEILDTCLMQQIKRKGWLYTAHLQAYVSSVCADSSVGLSVDVQSCNSHCSHKAYKHKLSKVIYALAGRLVPPYDSYLRGFIHCPVQWKQMDITKSYTFFPLESQKMSTYCTYFSHHFLGSRYKCVLCKSAQKRKTQCHYNELHSGKM